jgi:hypothetical protein
MPQCFVKGTMRAPAQVLIAVLLPACEEDQEVVRRLEGGVSPLLPRNFSLDIWFMKQKDPLLNIVRSTNCEIFNRSSRS